VIGITDERRKLANISSDEGRKKHRRLRNELQRATHKPKKEYLDSRCDEIMEFQRTGS
jgi:hypothetical protein